jgi:hypothetical protein
VRLRTSISAYFWASCSLESTDPSQPRKKASGIETRPGLSSGNQWKSIAGLVIIDGDSPVLGSAGLPETTGLKMIRPIEAMSPP